MKYPQLVSMPSAVSDWLEEQLEARGIDAVIYTRYILSLLHRDVVDVILSDEDLHFSHLKKEVRRSSGGRKRFCSSSDWWRHAQAEAEQLKRSAAVKCLISASDQNCGIESLIDELCEKLKEINSDVHNSTSVEQSKNLIVKKSITPDFQRNNISQQELANQYYAAFPPLNRNKTNESPLNILSLIPKWIPSPKKKLNNLNKNNLSANNDNKFDNHSNTIKAMSKTISRQQQKQNLNYNNRNNKDLYKNINNNKMNEQFNCFKNNNKWPIQNNILFNNSTFKGNDCVLIDDNNEDWNITGTSSMYEDLPVDIKELLNDDDELNHQQQHDDTVEMMNIANMRDTGRHNFIQCGTNIINSIWSTETAVDNSNNDNKFNNIIENHNSDQLKNNFNFNTFSLDNIKNNWNNLDLFGSSNQNKKDNNKDDDMFDNLINWNIYTTNEKWSDDTYYENEQIINQLSLSFIKLNHNKDSSPFNEVIPKIKSQPLNFLNQLKNFTNPPIPLKTIVDDKDDLLTSVHSHFRPINEKIDNPNRYIDGATFAVSNNLEKVNFKRSESGNMYLENENGMRKKYCEYKLNHNNANNSNTKKSDVEFLLKFIVCQNDKACQTDDDDILITIPTTLTDISIDHQEFQIDEDSNNSFKNNDDSISFNLDDNLKSNDYSIKSKKSDNSLAEITWKNSDDNDNDLCEKCIGNKKKNVNNNNNNNNNNKNNYNNMWNSDNLKNISYDLEWNDDNLRNIWNSDNNNEICELCLKNNKINNNGKKIYSINNKNKSSSSPNLQQTQLREDISQDGDQLLSDLNIWQKTYLEEIPTSESNNNNSVNTKTEQLLQKERKRRHSLITSTDNANNDDDNCWSFASRLEEDCLIQMSTVPTLRSVTL